ncbi:15584_t:CDS:2 [Gigaspora rosea]|nr:15584_t:CDS:2 [Gigaspora rosea]
MSSSHSKKIADKRKFFGSLVARTYVPSDSPQRTEVQSPVNTPELRLVRTSPTDISETYEYTPSPLPQPTSEASQSIPQTSTYVPQLSTTEPIPSTSGASHQESTSADASHQETNE